MKKVLLAFTGLIIGLSTMFVVPPAQAAIDTSPDCDTVAIIKCGAFSESELRSDAKQGDVPAVFGNFGISQGELNGFVDGVVWKDGRVTLGANGGGRVVATGAVTAGRWNNPTSDMTRIPNTDRAYRMSTSHFVTVGQTAFIKMVGGKFSFAVIKTCGNPVSAKPTPPPPAPAYKCESLVKEQDKTDKKVYHFTANASASNGAKIVKYRFDFGDGKTQETTARTIKHKYAQPGNYTVRLTVIVEVNGKLVEDTGAGCVKQITVEKPPVTPVFACQFMNIVSRNEDTRSVEVVADKSVSGDGVVFQYFAFDFGDGTGLVQSADGKANHVYAKEGNYTIRAFVVVQVKNAPQSVTSEACAKAITFGTTPPPVPPGPPETPEQPEVLSAVTQLVDTGPGAVIGAALSTVAGGTIAYRFVWLRRFM